ncbi:MAG TPA: hypothetical protein VN541_10135, partial [Tepidisphaeraceae bacterium]|nr:hypothetical protein [Tepidisphaeraceae bacterium]
DTEFYKPLDYDDQLLPGYLEKAVAEMDRQKLDVYGCLLMTLQNGAFSPRWWPNKPLHTMFTGNSADNQLPHSSVLMRASKLREAGNYAEKAVGLGADDYNTWYRIHKAGGKFFRDDVRNVVYRIHEKNSLPIRKARYGQGQPSGPSRGALIAGATAASVALLVGPGLNTSAAATTPATSVGQHAAADLVPARNLSLRQMMLSGVESANSMLKEKLKSALNKMWQSATGKSQPAKSPLDPLQHNDLLPPHS